MPKIMLHDAEAREALGRGVAKLTKAVSGTLGPRGMNAVMDRPIGTPIVSRDGVSIASEIELECPFENMGAQVLREVSKQTNEVAGDGTTTATVLANFLVQDGLALLAAGANPVELVEGLEMAIDETIMALKRSARSLDGAKDVRAIASIAANDAKLGEIVAEAFERAGNHGIVAVEFGSTVETTLEVIEGMAFERGYLSHHMVTDVERMQVVLDNPYILMMDVLCGIAFPLVPALGSTDSAAGFPTLFARFTATTAESDFSRPFIVGYGSSPSRRDPATQAPRMGERSPGSRTKSFRTCKGLRPRRAVGTLALSRSAMSPSVGIKNVGARDNLTFVAQWLTYALPFADASPAPSRAQTHGLPNEQDTSHSLLSNGLRVGTMLRKPGPFLNVVRCHQVPPSSRRKALYSLYSL